MQSVTFRAATLDDIEILLEFEQAVISAERPFNPTLKPDKIYYYDIEALIVSDQAELIVAVVADEIIGCGYVRIKKANPYISYSHYAYLGFMYIKAEFRGKGINQQLIERLKSWALGKNLTELRLDVYAQNISAIKAYQKAGFDELMIEMRMNIT